MSTAVKCYLVVHQGGRVRVLAVTRDKDIFFRAYELPRRTLLHRAMGARAARYVLLLQESYRALWGGRWVVKYLVFPRSGMAYTLLGAPRHRRYATRKSAACAANEWVRRDNALRAIGRTWFIPMRHGFGWLEE